jgi:hypothetical protein
MSDEKRAFILWGEKHKESCINFIRSLGLEVTYQITINEYEKTRTTEQNARYWPIMQIFCDNVKDDNGNYQSKEWWSHRLRCEFGFVIGTCQVKCYDSNILVDAPMPKSTTVMSTTEMAALQEMITDLLIQKGVGLPEWI